MPIDFFLAVKEALSLKFLSANVIDEVLYLLSIDRLWVLGIVILNSFEVGAHIFTKERKGLRYTLKNFRYDTAKLGLQFIFIGTLSVVSKLVPMTEGLPEKGFYLVLSVEIAYIFLHLGSPYSDFLEGLSSKLRIDKGNGSVQGKEDR